MTREQMAAARSELVFQFNIGIISLSTLRVELALLDHRVTDCGDYALRVVPSVYPKE
jgi:hypothetical protein